MVIIRDFSSRFINVFFFFFFFWGGGGGIYFWLFEKNTAIKVFQESDQKENTFAVKLCCYQREMHIRVLIMKFCINPTFKSNFELANWQMQSIKCLTMLNNFKHPIFVKHWWILLLFIFISKDFYLKWCSICPWNQPVYTKLRWYF